MRRRLGFALACSAWAACWTSSFAQDPAPAEHAEAIPPPSAEALDAPTAGAEHAEVERLPHDARLMVPVCSTLPFDQGALVRQLDVALSAIGVRLVLRGLVDPVDGGHAVIAIELEECAEDPERAFIVLTHDPSGMRTRAEVDLRSASSVERSRILAVTAASLLAEEWVALSVARLGNPYEERGPETVPPPINPYGGEPFEPIAPARNPYRGRLRSISREREAIREEARRTVEAMEASSGQAPRRMGDVGIVFRTHPASAGGLLGMDAGFVARLVPRLRLALGLAGIAGVANLAAPAFDEVAIRELVAHVTLYVGTESRWLWSGIGPSLESGWASAQSDRETNRGGTAALLVRATLRSQIARKVWLRVDAFFGYVLRPVSISTSSGARGGVIGSTIGLVAGISLHP